ncbi:hypothetical protein ACOI22_03635 [Glaciecola sp. 2405UD65-10]|uniref:hypothetical protein n=1 Tax=Glaciecola sp. 2405UD65-10 TaxID=3397244 RepID=UPI003B5A2473
MLDDKQTENIEYEKRLAAFKKRYNLKEINTSKTTASAFCISDYTLRLSRSTGKLLGTEAPKYTKYGRAVRYHAPNLMSWNEKFNKAELDNE